MFAMLGRCQQMHIQQAELKLTLFDAPVRPAQSYVCKVWAPIASRSALEMIEQVQRHLLRKLLGVSLKQVLKADLPEDVICRIWTPPLAAF